MFNTVDAEDVSKLTSASLRDLPIFFGNGMLLLRPRAGKSLIQPFSSVISGSHGSPRRRLVEAYCSSVIGL